MTPAERLIHAARTVKCGHADFCQAKGQPPENATCCSCGWDSLCLAVYAYNAAPAMTDEGRDSVVERLVREHLKVDRLDFRVAQEDLRLARKAYDAGTQSRQQPEAVVQLAKKLSDEIDQYGWGTDAAKIHTELFLALASLPAVPRQQPEAVEKK